MAKHAAPRTAVSTATADPGGVVLIRPIALSAQAYLGRLRHGAPTPPGRHART